MSDLAEKSKVNLDLWNLFIFIVSLGLTYQIRIKTLASIVFKKINFSKQNPLNVLGSKFDLGVKDIEILAIILVPLIMTLSRGHTGQMKRTVIMR